MADEVNLENLKDNENKKACPSCGAKVASDLSFCPSCGYDLSAHSDEFITCPSCGAKVNKAHQYCGNCGNKIAIKLCPSCNKPIANDEVFCHFCGANLNANEQVVEQINEEVKEDKIINLDNFDKPLNEDVKPDKKKKELKEEQKIIKPIRKKIFSILNLLIIAFVILNLLWMPLFTSGAYFNSFNLMFEENAGFIKGLDILKAFIASFDGGALNIDANLLSIDGHLIFKGIPFVNLIIHEDDVGYTPSFFILTALYGYVLLMSIIAFIGNFIGIFTYRPIRAKLLKHILISLTVFTILTYINIFFDYKGYDSFSIYLFALVFVTWFIEKIVFLVEVKEYDSYLLNKKK